LLECYWSWRQTTSVPIAQAFTGLAVAVLSFASFFMHYRFLSRMGCFGTTPPPLLRYSKFMAVMFAASVVPNHRHVSAMTLLGAVILLSAFGILAMYLVRLLSPAHSSADLVGAVLLGFCLLFSASAAIGRLCQGFSEAYQSRHHTLLIPAFLAIYFYLLSKPWRGKQRLVLALWVVSLLPAALLKPTIVIRQLADDKRAWAACYLRTGNILGCNQEADLVLYPTPERNGMQWKLDYLQQHKLNFFYDAGKK